LFRVTNSGGIDIDTVAELLPTHQADIDTSSGGDSDEGDEAGKKEAGIVADTFGEPGYKPVQSDR
jgi:phosphoribosylanthranilate isomerase